MDTCWQVTVCWLQDHRVTTLLCQVQELRRMCFSKWPHKLSPTPRLCRRLSPGSPTELIRSAPVGTDGTRPLQCCCLGRLPWLVALLAHLQVELLLGILRHSPSFSASLA